MFGWFVWIELLVGLYFLYVATYTLVFSVAGKFYRAPRHSEGNKRKFAVLIPAYKEDGVIVDVAQKALAQSYPADRFRVVIIADQLQRSTIEKLRALPIDVLEVTFEKSTKVKSLQFALQSIPNDFDNIVILDADNVMGADFLEKMNAVHNSGQKAVQGERKPKNTNNTLSYLDGLSEAINNHIYRQGHTALGLSASISGSGISLDYKMFYEIMSGMTSVGGFDREMELLFLGRGVKVIYNKPAFVLDEKVQKTGVFENQRKRWISSQYHYLARYFRKGCAALLKGNITYFNSAVLRNIQLPRLVNLGLIVLLTVGMLFLRDILFFGYWIWPAMLGMIVVGVALAIPAEFYSRNFLIALLKIPGLFFRMLLLMFRLKGVNKQFIHTPHGLSEESK
jgi:cellulose synthase/poly-beta-1,6-N-acetylglucosamine synthase-like glycosyltransferase